MCLGMKRDDEIDMFSLSYGLTRKSNRASTGGDLLELNLSAISVKNVKILDRTCCNVYVPYWSPGPPGLGVMR